MFSILIWLIFYTRKSKKKKKCVEYSHSKTKLLQNTPLSIYNRIIDKFDWQKKKGIDIIRIEMMRVYT